MSIAFRLNLILFVLCSFIKTSFADFEVQKEFCTMSNNFLGQTSDGTEYNGVINISFTTENIVLPLINVSLSRNINPTEVRLSWPNAKLFDSLQRPLFDSEVQDRMESEIKGYFELKKEGYAFYSKAYGFYRFQHFMALFLSQNDLLLSFKNEGSQNFETQVVSLAGSDLAFREMTYHCHYDSVSDYLAVDISRKQPVFKSWTDGYGITAFGGFENLLPAQAKYPNDITKYLNQDSAISYVKLSDIFKLLEKKSDLNNSIDEIQISEEYISLNQDIEQSAEKAVNLSSQKYSLDGEQGYIQKIDQDLQDIAAQIVSVETSIQTYEKRAKPLKERFLILQVKILELRGRLAGFSNQQRQMQSDKERFQQSLKSLKDMITSFVDEYSEKEVENFVPEPLFTPYTLEEIESSNSLVDQKIQERNELQRLLGLIGSINYYIEDLSISYESAMGIFNQISEAKINQVRLKEFYHKTEMDKIQLLESIGNVDFTLLENSINADKKLGKYKDLKNSDVRTALVEDIKASYSDYDSLVDGLKSERIELLPHIVCSSDYFLSSFQGQCFDPVNLDKGVDIELFVDQLDSSDISNLSFIIDRSNNLIERYSSSLAQLITERIKSETHESNSKSVQSLWSEILYNRWAFFVVRSLDANENFSFKNMEDALKDQKNKIREIENKADDIAAEIIKIDRDLSKLDSRFLDLESKYFESLSKNQELIIAQMDQTEVDVSDTNLACLVDITNFELCVKEVTDLVSKSNTELSEKVKNIKDVVVVLVVSARFNILKLENNLNASIKKLKGLNEEKQIYIQTSDYEAKNKVYQNVRGEHLRQILILKTLHEQKFRLESERSSALAEKQKYSGKLNSLILEIEGLVTVMKPTLEKLRPKCDQLNDLFKNVRQVDKQILDILDITAEPPAKSSVCQIDF